MVKGAIRDTLKSSKNKLIFAVIFFISLSFYVLAINIAGSLSIFFNHTPVLIIISQILLIILNSALTALVMTMTIQVIKNRQGGNDTIFQSALALIFSVGTTGCYICGSLLLPASGIMASFVALPLRGLEVKILTIFLLLYVLYDVSKKYYGICSTEKEKKLSIHVGSKKFSLSNKLFDQLQPIAISLAFIVLVFSLPAILPTDNVAASSDVCPSKVKATNVDWVE